MDALIICGTNSWMHRLKRALIHGRIDKIEHYFVDASIEDGPNS
jgi:hypothetical protein